MTLCGIKPYGINGVGDEGSGMKKNRGLQIFIAFPIGLNPTISPYSKASFMENYTEELFQSSQK